jgi:hypothetical protein
MASMNMVEQLEEQVYYLVRHIFAINKVIKIPY